jgi:hypothetical protein
MGLFGGWAALERGYHAMTSDGPGQQAALFLRGSPFRHDWEAVLTPVVDAMVARPDVDPDRIAVIGSARRLPGAAGARLRAPLDPPPPGEPSGVGGDSRFDLYQEMLRYRLGDEVGDITTPAAHHRARGRAVWPGQSQALYARLSDWLDRYLAA